MKVMWYKQKINIPDYLNYSTRKSIGPDYFNYSEIKEADKESD